MPEVSVPLVYLDSADWAYLEEGSAPELLMELRALGEAGQVAFLLTHEHWVEVAGLDGGLQRRLRFLCEFPGTYRMTASAEELLQFEARQLAAAARGGSPAVVALPLEALGPASFSVLEPWVNDFGRSVRDIDRRVVSAKRYLRKVTVPRDAKSIRTHRKKLESFLRGDAGEFVRRVRADGELRGPAHKWLLKPLVPRVGRAIKYFQGRGLALFPNLRFDPVFSSTVVPCFEDEVRRDAELVAKIHEAWRRKGDRGLAPALACATALAERLEMQPDLALKESDAVDARHAAYAPYVAVFTCDKRNHGPLKQALRSVGRTTAVIRTGKHEHLRRSINAALASWA